MSTLSLQALNAVFFVFHTGLIAFNVLGWAHPKTRRANLATLGATAFSWFVMGAWYGVGYCVCTEWHWQVRQALGYRDQADSYIQFLVQALTPIRASDEAVRLFCGAAFGISFAASLALNLRDRRAHLPVSAPRPRP